MTPSLHWNPRSRHKALPASVRRVAGRGFLNVILDPGALIHEINSGRSELLELVPYIEEMLGGETQLSIIPPGHAITKITSMKVNAPVSRKHLPWEFDQPDSAKEVPAKTAANLGPLREMAADDDALASAVMAKLPNVVPARKCASARRPREDEIRRTRGSARIPKREEVVEPVNLERFLMTRPASSRVIRGDG
jgi:hypothetical protein